MVQSHAILANYAQPVGHRCLAAETAVDGLGSPATVADGRGHQVELRHVAAGPHAVNFCGPFAIHANTFLAFDQGFEAGEIGLLANGRDDRAGGNLKLRARDGNRPATAGGVRLAQVHADAAHGDDAVAFLAEAGRRGQELDADAFLDRLFHFLANGRHLLDGPPVEDGHVRAQSLADAGCIDGRVAAADHDDHHVLAQFQLFSVVEAAEEVDAREDVGSDLALDAQAGPLLRAPEPRRRRRTARAGRRA